MNTDWSQVPDSKSPGAMVSLAKFERRDGNQKMATRLPAFMQDWADDYSEYNQFLVGAQFIYKDSEQPLSNI
jgi:hypothetical protein